MKSHILKPQKRLFLDFPFNLARQESIRNLKMQCCFGSRCGEKQTHANSMPWCFIYLFIFAELSGNIPHTVVNCFQTTVAGLTQWTKLKSHCDVACVQIQLVPLSFPRSFCRSYLGKFGRAMHMETT